MTAAPSLVADRYRLFEPLGAGGMGRVWRARDETLGRDVAVKQIILPPELLDNARDVAMERTLREARAAARLTHPNVVRVYDVLEFDGQPWLVMEYVPSRSLDQTLRADGPLPPRRVAEIGLAVLAALQAAHRVGVHHRDIKPGNVLLGDDGRVVLTDFGIARIEGDGHVTRTGLVLGSPEYIAPERARDGTAGAAGDLWSLGATLYAAVEGRSPYGRGSAMETLMALASDELDPPQRAGALAPALRGLLRKDPRARAGFAETEERLRAVLAAPTERRRRSWLSGWGRSTPAPAPAAAPPVTPVPAQRPAPEPPTVVQPRTRLDPPTVVQPPIPVPAPAPAAEFTPAAEFASVPPAPADLDPVLDEPAASAPAPRQEAAADGSRAAGGTLWTAPAVDASADAEPAAAADLEDEPDAVHAEAEPDAVHAEPEAVLAPGEETEAEPETDRATEAEAEQEPGQAAEAEPATAGAAAARIGSATEPKGEHLPAPVSAAGPRDGGGEETDLEPASESQAAPEAVAAEEPEPEAGAQPESAIAPASEADPATAPEPEHAAGLHAGSSSEPEDAAALRAEPEAAFAAVAVPEAERVEAEHTTEHVEAEPDVAAEPETNHVVVAPGPDRVEADPEVVPEPTTEHVVAEPDVAAEPTTEHVEAEPEVAAEPEVGADVRTERVHAEPQTERTPTAPETERVHAEPEVVAEPETKRLRVEPEVQGLAGKEAGREAGAAAGGGKSAPAVTSKEERRPAPVVAAAAVPSVGGGARTGAKPRTKVLAAVAGGLVIVVLAAWLVLRSGGDDSNRTAAPASSADAKATATATGGGTSAPAGSPSVAPSSEPAGGAPSPAAPSSPAVGGNGAGQLPPLPAGWVDYHDPSGFSVYVPAGWRQSKEGTMVYFRGNGRVLGIDQTDKPKSDPVRDWQTQRDSRVASGDFPGYVEIHIQPVQYFVTAADWEFTFSKSGTRQHVNNRGVVTSPKQAYGFYWQTTDADWAAARPDLDLVFASFRPRV